MPKYPSPSGGSTGHYTGPGTSYKKNSKVGAGQEAPMPPPPRRGGRKGGKAAAAARLANLQKGRAKATGKKVGAGQIGQNEMTPLVGPAGGALPRRPMGGPGGAPPMARAMGPTGTNPPPPPMAGPAGPMAPSGLRQNATAAIGRPGVPSPAPTVRAPSAALPAPGTASAVAPPGGAPVRGRMPPPRPPGMGQGKATGRGQGRRTTKKSAPGGRY